MPRRRTPHRSPARLSAFLFAIAAAEVAAFVVLYAFFVRTVRGQQLDYVALASDTLGAVRLGHPVNTVLNAISIAAVVVVAGIVGFIAIIRRRFALAVTSIVLIGGANLTAELMKRFLVRPDLGVDEARASAGNSFPSGHTAIAASAVIAFVLVLPPRLRGGAAIAGAIYGAVVGVATLSAGWHRPSDAIAAFLVVGVWAALAGVLLRFLRRRGERVVDAESHKRAGLTLGVIGLASLAVAVLGLRLTDRIRDIPIDQLTRHDKIIAYGGSSAGILAASCLTLAIVLGTVHRIVPKRPD